ncbi:25.6 kDa Uvr/REP helicase [Spodoptera frugiperda ascovirus 1a]|uniref:25.6 kDa Uvr/REP helicase n=1 Tax=Spodoptera frugiperda ascovirus 1a TaxID=113370 RepID=Q0E515_SFAVA|nr:25.6 kDa Uvr/REP helicase [Spodoptera frugiperda ascovirus 1a]CAL44686.1 25.6 kDa Uvr/REP helicase [Spodoptera frugiperda ascovirus 1a]
MEIKHVLIVSVALMGAWLAWKRAMNDAESVFSNKYTIIAIAALFAALALFRRFNGQRGTWRTLTEGVEDLKSFSEIADNALTNHSIEKQQHQQGADSRGEIACRTHLERRFGVPFGKVRPDWLVNPSTRAKLELDCYNEELRLAVEYNGRQHYEYVPRFHTCRNDLTTQKARDVVKHEICRRMNVDLIDVPYTVHVDDIPDYLDRCLHRLGRIQFIDDDQ